MGIEIEYPEPTCSTSPTGAHHYTVLSGSVWRCKYCWTPLWCPRDWDEATSYASDAKHIGIRKAYKKWLKIKTKTILLLTKLEKIRQLRQTLPEEELMMAIAAIVTAKELDDINLESWPGDLEDMKRPHLALSAPPLYSLKKKKEVNSERLVVD